MIANKNEEKASISLKKIIGICLVFVFLSGLYVFASNTNINNYKIILSNGYEMSVMTSKTKVSDVLEEKHILLLPEEKVVPGMDEQVGEDKIIRISKKSEEQEVIEIAEENADISMEEILQAYAPIVEKIVVEQVPIPFETITKDVSNNAGETSNKVIREGKEGLKEVTYKVKYQNEKEIERIEISSVVIEEPVDKVIQVKAAVTNRSASTARTATDNPATTASTSLAAKVAGKTPIVVNMNTSAYCSCAKCCGKTNGVTSSGAKASAWYTVAAGKSYPIGTVIYIPALKNKPNGGWFVVQDRGGAISNSRIDIYMGSHNQALSFGRKNLECYVYM